MEKGERDKDIFNGRKKSINFKTVEEDKKSVR
jgi:hypothetical protein